MKKLYTPLLLLLITLNLSTSMADDKGINIGVLASLSGNWQEIGQNIVQGVTLAKEELNSSGGILDKEIRFNIQDTDEEKSGTKVVSGFHFLRTQGIDLFIGPSGVPGTLAISPIAKNDNIVLMAPTSTNSFYLNSHRFFNAGGDNFVTTKATAELAYKDGMREVAIFGSLQPWESDQAEIFEKEFVALGGKITSKVSPPADQTDLRIEALKIVKSKPQGIFFANFNQSAHAAKAVKQFKFDGKKYAAFLDGSHINASNGALNNTFLYLFNPPSSDFVKRYSKRFGNPPGAFADTAYDAAYSLLTAIKVANSTEPENIIKALHEIKIKGSSGKEDSFDKNGLLVRGITLHEVVDGEMVRPMQPPSPQSLPE